MTGPSGAGKGTLIQLVLPRFPELALAVSATTRAQRPGEQDGVHYWFLDREEFDRRVVAGEFLEWVDYVGNRYGTLHSGQKPSARDMFEGVFSQMPAHLRRQRQQAGV